MRLTRENAQKELFNFRIDHGITQERLSELSGVSRPTITNIERGEFKPSATILFRLNEYIKKFPENDKD